MPPVTPSVDRPGSPRGRAAATAPGVTPSSSHHDALLPAIGLRLLSVLLFAGMNASIKLAQQGGAALGEILFFRQFGAALLVTTRPGRDWRRSAPGGWARTSPARPSA